jgi:winged helix DNA-binding protein
MSSAGPSADGITNRYTCPGPHQGGFGFLVSPASLGSSTYGRIMTRSDIAQRRLLNQHIGLGRLEKPVDVVAWLGAVQSQDYAGAKWALGLRLQRATDDDIEQAFTDGSILRTHLLRPTWHFVAPADIRWMLALTAPRVHAINAYMYRKLELDQAIFSRSNAALLKALQGCKQLTREELRGVLQKAGIATDGEFRMGYLMMRAELDGIVCSGARRGSQFTYALLDERVRHARRLERDEALAELARRFFLSRGPATLQDFAKWSGLTTTDARSGLEAVKAELRHEVVDGQAYWFSTTVPSARDVSPTAFLLSIYDEYISGYKDRSAIGDARTGAKLIALGNALNYIIVVDSQIVGTWKRTLRKGSVVIETNSFTPLTKAETRAVAVAAHRFGVFLGRPVVLA